MTWPGHSLGDDKLCHLSEFKQKVAEGGEFAHILSAYFTGNKIKLPNQEYVKCNLNALLPT